VNTSKEDAEFDPFAHDNGKKKANGSSSGPAWLALLLALAVAGWNGYQWWLDRSQQTSDNRLAQSISRLEAEQSGIQDALRSLESRLVAAEQDGGETEIEGLRADLQGIQSRLSGVAVEAADAQAQQDAGQAALVLLQQRIDALEASVAALAVRSESPGRRMDIAEVAYLLRLAEERLGLFGDAGSANEALALADAHLAALADPLYVPVRRRIAESRRALQAMPQADVPELSAALVSLQDSIAELPFEGDAQQAASATVSGTGQDVGWWQRIKAALSPLVTVRRRVDGAGLLSLEDRDYLRQGLWLQLESARLALMRRDAETWARSLELARSTIKGRFATGNRQVRAALAELDDLQAVELRSELPDIGAAAAQLRLLKESTPGPRNTPPDPAVGARENGPGDGGEGGPEPGEADGA